MCIKFVLWRKTQKSTKAFFLSIFVILLFFGLNFHLIFTLKYDQNVNETIIENLTLTEYLLSSETFQLWIHVILWQSKILEQNGDWSN
jgi:hypothetical protein